MEAPANHKQTHARWLAFRFSSTQTTRCAISALIPHTLSSFISILFLSLRFCFRFSFSVSHSSVPSQDMSSGTNYALHGKKSSRDARPAQTGSERRKRFASRQLPTFLWISGSPSRTGFCGVIFALNCHGPWLYVSEKNKTMRRCAAVQLCVWRTICQHAGVRRSRVSLHCCAHRGKGCDCRMAFFPNFSLR